MRYTCECGSRISTLKGLRAERDGIRHFGEQLMIRGKCSQCGNRYCFLPELLDPKRFRKGGQNHRSIMFGRYLAEKLGEAGRWK